MPGEYEVLAPWVRRIARAYGVTDYVFYKHALGCPEGEPVGMNANPPAVALERLEVGAGVPAQQMRDMTTDRVMARTVAELRQTVMMGPEPVQEPSSWVARQRGFVDGV